MAALSSHSLHFTIPTPNLHAKPQNPRPSLSFSTLSKPLSLASRRVSSPLSASQFTNPLFGEALGNEQELVMEIRANAPKRLKKDAGRLYVGNLPFSTTCDDLFQLFSQAGTVINVDVVYDRVTDRSRGFAFVSMESSEEAEVAIQMFNQSLLQGRAIQVNFPEVPRGAERDALSVASSRRPSHGYVDTPHKLYAGNLGWAVDSQTLKNAFKHLGGLLGAKVVFDRGTGRSRGFGFVVFDTEEAASAALESMNGAEVEGRPLRLSYATEQRREAGMQENTNETSTHMQQSKVEMESSVSI